jgi:hypothetical protein
MGDERNRVLATGSPGLQGPRGDGRRWGMTKLILLLVLVGLASCGGKVIGGGAGSSGTEGSSGAAGSSGTGGSSGAGTLGSAGSSGGGGGSEGGSTLGTCNGSGTNMGEPCVRCSDGKWHCGGISAFEQCPPGTANGVACGSNIEATCLQCDGDGSAMAFTCEVPPTPAVWVKRWDLACVQ